MVVGLLLGAPVVELVLRAPSSFGGLLHTFGNVAAFTRYDGQALGKLWGRQTLTLINVAKSHDVVEGVFTPDSAHEN